MERVGKYRIPIPVLPLMSHFLVELTLNASLSSLFTGVSQMDKKAHREGKKVVSFSLQANGWILIESVFCPGNLLKTVGL